MLYDPPNVKATSNLSQKNPNKKKQKETDRGSPIPIHK